MILRSCLRSFARLRLVSAPAVLSCLLLALTPAFAQKRVALVIGNSAYINVPILSNPANDATLMANTLRSLGFTLVGGGAQINLDKITMDRAVQAFGEEITDADVALFYYAGHGVQVRGDNYLVPINANPLREADVDFQMLDVNLVLHQMEGATTRLNLVILDACRNNPFGGRGLRSTVGGLAQMQAPEGTLISFATQPGNVAIDGSRGHSPFTEALADTIRRPGLGLFDAFNDVGVAIKRVTGGTQQPWFASSPITGTFYFSGGIGQKKSAELETQKILQNQPISFSCSTLEEHIQADFSNASLSREQLQKVLTQLRDIEAQLPNPCKFGKVLGGPIIKIQKCFNDATYVELGGSAGGPFVLTNSTKNYQDTIPARKGQWIIGTAGAPYYCLASLTPTQVWPGTYVATMSVR